jgi:diguanylate cyclase (GGDEF)-like protein/PAS domain S-box-containing protein
MRPAGAAADHEQEFPSDIHGPLVDSLFKEGRTLLLGTLINASAIFSTYWKTGNGPLLACSIAFTLVGFARLAYVQAYHRAHVQLSDRSQLNNWEFGYLVGATASVGLLGLWCYLSFVLTDDAFAHLVSYAMTIGYVIGIFGRNFGNPKFVVVQISAAWFPMSAALLVHGNPYHWFFAGLLMSFALAVKFISERVRKMLLDAVIATSDVTALAQRFDTALTNMPHGLVMFDQGGEVRVANAKVHQILGLDSDFELKGASAHKLISHCMQRGALSLVDAKRIADRVARTAEVGTTEMVVELADGRTLEFTFQAMERGGAVAVVQDITERRRAEQTINRMARFDMLTGLPNRSQFTARLERAFLKDGTCERCAIHFIDLDHFKEVNDTLGHSRGDMLLQVVAERLQDVLRECDMPARFGGDEFVVLQSKVDETADAALLADSIITAIGRPYTIDGSEILISASIGIANLPGDGIDAEQLVKNADLALYKAKAAGRSRWCFFQPEMEVQAQERRQLEHDLRIAIDQRQFQLYYQPIIDFASGRIKTCEALIRWCHPGRGLVSPAEFIPVAEETGMIADIGKLVLAMACEECLTWPGNVGVAVNISPLQFKLSDVSELVSTTLRASGLPAERLEIEITESALLQNKDGVRAALRRLRSEGVRVSLDDFGTGYSSLSYLHSIPLDKVKIDRSFLEGLTRKSRSMTLLCGISRLSTELGLRVTVEGIETTRQLELVNLEQFVHEGQGFLFSRPVPADEVLKLLEASAGQPFARGFELPSIDGWRAASGATGPSRGSGKSATDNPDVEVREPA